MQGIWYGGCSKLGALDRNGLEMHVQISSPSRLTRRTLLQSGAGLAALPFASGVSVAQTAPDPVHFSLEFRTYGPNSPVFLGVDKGIWRDLNIAPTIDGSGGSNDSVTRIASGAYDAGYADLSTLIDFTSRNPAAAPVMVMPLFDRFPAAVISLKPHIVKTLADLKGLRLGMATTDAGSKIFPGLLRLNGIDANSFKTMTVDVKLRDTMLLRHDVDAVVGFDYTTIFNLLGAGVKLDDINVLYFSSLGFDFVGTALLVGRPMLERNPDLVRRIALASTRCFVTAFTERDGLDRGGDEA